MKVKKLPILREQEGTMIFHSTVSIRFYHRQTCMLYNRPGDGAQIRFGCEGGRLWLKTLNNLYLFLRIILTEKSSDTYS